MSMIHLKDEKLEDLIKEGIVIVDFYAEWCGPCKMLSPILDVLASEREDIKIVKINVDEQEELAQKNGVMSIPSLRLYKEGKLEKSHVGFMTKDALNEWIDGE